MIFWDNFRRKLEIIFKISVRFKLNELRCKFLSFFDIISDSEEGGILFLQIAIMFEMKNWMGAKEKIEKQEEKIPFNKLTRNKTNW